MAATETTEKAGDIEEEKVVDDKTNLAQKTSKVEGGAVKILYLGPSGLLGVMIMVTLFLVCAVYFNMIVSIGEFNVKYVKERMPLGKEY